MTKRAFKEQQNKICETTDRRLARLALGLVSAWIVTGGATLLSTPDVTKGSHLIELEIAAGWSSLIFAGKLQARSV